MLVVGATAYTHVKRRLLDKSFFFTTWNFTVGKINNKYIPGNPAHIHKFTSRYGNKTKHRSGWSITYAKLFQMILFSKTHVLQPLLPPDNIPIVHINKQQMTWWVNHTSGLGCKNLHYILTAKVSQIGVHDQLILASVGNEGNSRCFPEQKRLQIHAVTALNFCVSILSTTLYSKLLRNKRKSLYNH